MDGLRAWARIDRQALRHNVAVIRELAAKTRVIAVIKANAYGHTLEQVVPVLESMVDGFAVATIDEGIVTRTLSPELPVMVLSEFNHFDQITQFRAHDLQPVVHRKQQAGWLAEVAPLPGGVWLKIDSGMHRLGIEPEEVTRVYQMLVDTGHSVSIMSHLASADSIDGTQSQEQIDTFARSTRATPGIQGLVNSAGLVAFPGARLDLVRPGLLLYGISPFDDHSQSTEIRAIEDRLQPVMSLEARIVAVKKVSPGDRIGYGGSKRFDAPGRIGIVGFGYADGYPRGVDERAYTIVNGKRAPLAGRVSMDMLTVDLTDCNASEGDVVQLWGDQLNVRTVASWANTIPYELLCRVAARVPRLGINNTRYNG